MEATLIDDRGKEHNDEEVDEALVVLEDKVAIAQVREQYPETNADENCQAGLLDDVNVPPLKQVAPEHGEYDQEDHA